MVDINPAALSRPAIGLSTPILSSKTINVSVPSVQKPKTSQLIPARIDLEPIYAALKSSIGPEGWAIYKESTTQFLIGPPPHPAMPRRIPPIGAVPPTNTVSLSLQAVSTKPSSANG